jgi:predicted phage terminase large subunit-like protein
MPDLLTMFRDRLAHRHGHARRRVAARNGGNDLVGWAQRYLAEHFTQTPSKMHLWLGQQLDTMQYARGTKLNVLGPRGGAKSTIASLAFPLKAAVQGVEPYIWIVSDTRHQACAHLENLKTELLENERLAADYPDAAGRGPVWRAGSVTLRNGVTLEAFGTGQRIRGRRRGAHRPSLIICDDLQNDGHIESVQQRLRSYQWFHGTLLKAGTPRTNVVNLATTLHRDALAMQLARTPGWNSRIFRAIQRWPENMSLWHEWEAIYADVENPQAAVDARAFYRRNQPKMDAGAVLLWPEMEDLYTLMRMRAESGRTAFEREKQNSPIDPERCEWPESYFGESIWFDEWPRSLRLRTVALDPSKGGDARRGDYSALVALGIDARSVLYVEADLARRDTSQMVADAAAFCRRFRPDAFGVEVNQFQELLAEQLADEFRRQGMPDARPSTLDNRVNKQVRIRRLGPHLAQGRLRFKGDSPSTRLLVDQLKDFPVGDHDDGPDALEMALRLAGQLLGGRAAPDDGLGNRLAVG